MSPHSGAAPIDLRSALLAALVAVSRGGNQVAIKLTLTAMGPSASALARMATSAATIGLWSTARAASLLPRRHEIGPLAALGTIFTIQIFLLHTGADLTSPAYAVLLINANPIFANLISHAVVPEDRLTLPRLAGVLSAFVGVSIILLGRPEPELAPAPALGNALVLVSGALVGARTVYLQRLVQRMETVKAVFWQTLSSLPFFALGAWLAPARIARGDFSGEALAAILYQGTIVGGFALLLWVKLLRRHTAGTLTPFSFFTPVAGLLLSAWIFGEEISWRVLVGGLAVLAGVRAASRRAPPQQSSAAASE